MNTIDLNQHRQRRILLFSDTYGIDAGNGVARFLHDLRRMAEGKRLPLELVVPARDETAAGLISIRAPAFTVPGYGKLKISMPLRHHRKNIERHIKSHRPDCVHVSTPGPFGCFGVTLADRYRIPLVGIYHTDFPAYASAIVAGQLNRLRQDPKILLAPVAAKLLPLVWPLLGQLSAANPEAPKDLATIGEIISRNLQAISGDSRTDQYLCSLAEKAAVNMLQKFYSRFDLILTRSTEQQQTLARQLNFAPERVRCLLPGTDIDRFHPGHADRSIWPTHGVPQDAFVVLYVGRITPEKNIDFLHDVWTEVQSRSQEQDLRLVVVGHGEPNQLNRFRSLENTHVIGSHGGEALSKLYAAADLVVFPSATETLGQVGLEAGASGVPVMVAESGGPKMYVKHGETGWVLPTQAPSLWADQILSLSESPEILRVVGTRAREHIANHFSFDHSLRSYWELHAEAIQLRNRKRKSNKKKQIKAGYLAHLQDQIPQQGVMVISDFHAGKRYGNPKHRNQKREAIKTMLSMAMERKLDVVFGGDFGDHGSRVARLEADFEAFRGVREELGFRGQPVFVRGNHDYGFTSERLEQLTGGCRVQDSLAYYHPQAKVTICHGHIFGLARTLNAIRTAQDVNQLLERLHEDLLDEELKPAVIAYDIANMIEAGLATHGLRGLSTAWEGVFQYRAMMAEQLLKRAGNSNQGDEATWKMIAGLVGTHDNVEVAAMLGVACGGWASLFGHTHEPLAKRKTVRRHDDGPRVAQVVGNSGHINRKHPTCVVAEFPQVTVFQYEAKPGQLRPLRRSSLSGTDVEAFVKRTDPAQKPTVVCKNDSDRGIDPINKDAVARPSLARQAAGAILSPGRAAQ